MATWIGKKSSPGVYRDFPTPTPLIAARGPAKGLPFIYANVQRGRATFLLGLARFSPFLLRLWITLLKITFSPNAQQTCLIDVGGQKKKEKLEHWKLFVIKVIVSYYNNLSWMLLLGLLYPEILPEIKPNYFKKQHSLSSLLLI